MCVLGLTIRNSRQKNSRVHDATVADRLTEKVHNGRYIFYAEDRRFQPGPKECINKGKTHQLCVDLMQYTAQSGIRNAQVEQNNWAMLHITKNEPPMVLVGVGDVYSRYELVERFKNKGLFTLLHGLGLLHCTWHRRAAVSSHFAPKICPQTVSPPHSLTNLVVPHAVMVAQRQCKRNAVLTCRAVNNIGLMIRFARIATTVPMALEKRRTWYMVSQ